MWALAADRKTLLDMFGKERWHHLQRAVHASPSTLLDRREELLLLWATDPTPGNSEFPPGERLPHAIVVRADDMREFIAWVTTYIGGYRPFTAFFRVISPEDAQLAFEPSEPSLGGLENAVVGLIISEALTLSTTQRSVSALPLLPSESTYCYSFGRALAIGRVQRAKGFDPVSAPLAIARRLTRQPARKLGDDALAAALKVVSGLATHTSAPGASDVPAFVWEACQELASQGEVKRSWDLLGTPGAPLSRALNEMRGSREHRVRIFERVLGDTNQVDVITSSFLAGLLADQIAPGTFEHVDLLLSYIDRYPMALVWYGLCAGLRPDSEVQQVGNCLGRRLVRDLLASDPVISRPKYDISVGELEVYLDREQPLEFRVASQNHIAVELLPGVPAYMKWPVPPAAEGVPGGSKEVPLHPGREQRELPLKSALGEIPPSEQRLSSEQEYAIRELERALERVKLVFKEPGRGGDTDRLDEDRKRLKRH
jgi:hypothetical protein